MGQELSAQHLKSFSVRQLCDLVASFGFEYCTYTDAITANSISGEVIHKIPPDQFEDYLTMLGVVDSSHHEFILMKLLQCYGQKVEAGQTVNINCDPSKLICEALALENPEAYTLLQAAAITGGKSHEDIVITIRNIMRVKLFNEPAPFTSKKGVTHSRQELLMPLAPPYTLDIDHVYGESVVDKQPLESVHINSVYKDHDAEIGSMLTKAAAEHDKNTKTESSRTDEHLQPYYPSQISHSESLVNPSTRSLSLQEAELIADEADRVAREQRSHFDCPVCLDKHPINGSYIFECDHRICEEALTGWLSSKIEVGEVSEEMLTCPHGGCKQPISEVTIRECTSKDVYEKFVRFRTKRYLASGEVDGNIRTCPNEACDYQFVLEGGGNLNFECPSCISSYCFKCKANEGRPGPCHPGLTCAERLQQIKTDKRERRKMEEWRELNGRAEELYEELAKQQGWRKCPHCSVMIEQNQGCAHMTCRNCRCNFCYFCGKWDQANPTNRGDCGTVCTKRASAATAGAAAAGPRPAPLRRIRGAHGGPAGSRFMEPDEELDLMDDFRARLLRRPNPIAVRREVLSPTAARREARDSSNEDESDGEERAGGSFDLGDLLGGIEDEEEFMMMLQQLQQGSP